MRKAQEKTLNTILDALFLGEENRSWMEMDNAFVQLKNFFTGFYKNNVDVTSALNIEIAFLNKHLEDYPALASGMSRTCKQLVRQAELGIVEYEMFKKNPSEFVRQYEPRGKYATERTDKDVPITKARLALKALRKRIATTLTSTVAQGERNRISEEIIRYKGLFSVERSYISEYLDYREYSEQDEKKIIKEKLIARFDKKANREILRIEPKWNIQ
jgi:hypothetical protein